MSQAQRGDPSCFVPRFGDGHGGFPGVGTKLVELGT
jgi:hypothetical protein